MLLPFYSRLDLIVQSGKHTYTHEPIKKKGTFYMPITYQHKVQKTKKNKTKTQHNMCWTSIYANKHK